MNQEIKQRIEQIKRGEVPQGYKKTKVGIVPSEWEVKRLKNIAKYKTAKNKENKFTCTLTNSATQGIVKQIDFFDKQISNNDNIDGYYIVEKNDFVYNPRISVTAPCGPINKSHIEETGIMSPLYTIFKVNVENEKYIELYFKSTYWYKYMNKIANYGVRSDRMNVTNEDFFNLPLPIPTLNEQQKIAEILTTHDKVIELKEKLLIAKQQQKKWLMQNLLTGKKRLSGFTGEWKQVKAQELFKNVTDKSHCGKSDVLSATQDRGIIPRSDIDIDIKYDVNSLNSYKKVSKGNFVISLRSFQGGIEYSEYDGIISPAYTVLMHIKPIASGYYRQFLKSVDYISRLNVAVYGIRDGKQISYSDFGIIRIPFPPLPEQTAIAEILSTADKEIELLQKQLTEEKQKKKALMQLLLTGIVRVNI